MQRPKVLLTNAIHPAWMGPLQAECDVVEAPDAKPATLAALLAHADGLIVRAQLAPDVFDHAPRLRAVVRHGVGLDMIPVPAATTTTWSAAQNSASVTWRLSSAWPRRNMHT